MDIGDPNEIPATRKRLPSMQELGAFDDIAPEAPQSVSRPARTRPPAAAEPVVAVTPVPVPVPTSAPEPAPAPEGAPSPAAASAPAAPRPALTPEQLRQALAKADPVTRQKLLRLIAGGRTIQQLSPGSGGSSVGEGPRASTLVMGLGAARDTTDRPKPPPPRASAADTSPARAAASRRAAGESLMQIDANTELLDASPPPAAAGGDRHAGLQAQLDSARQQAPPRADPAAHKVLFPAYDPRRHGADVHTTTRRRSEGPVEGHFPAPRQPFRASYQHPDGKPMTPEESKVEEVLQAQRCEETLSVLAREGVNGLLLSPRDLDAAVNNGLLSAETAATLWRTWAALRPVIHVIEDEPPEAPAVAATPAEAEAAPQADPGTTNAEANLPPTPAAVTAPLPLDPPPAPAAVAPPVPAPPSLPPRVREAAAARQEPAPATPRRPEIEPAVDPVWAATQPPPLVEAAAHRGPPADQRGAAWKRLRRMLTWVFWAFVAYSVITTGLKYAVLLWHTGWGWALLDWLQQQRQH